MIPMVEKLKGKSKKKIKHKQFMKFVVFDNCYKRKKECEQISSQNRGGRESLNVLVSPTTIVEPRMNAKNKKSKYK